MGVGAIHRWFLYFSDKSIMWGYIVRDGSVGWGKYFICLIVILTLGKKQEKLYLVATVKYSIGSYAFSSFDVKSIRNWKFPVQILWCTFAALLTVVPTVEGKPWLPSIIANCSAMSCLWINLIFSLSRYSSFLNSTFFSVVLKSLQNDADQHNGTAPEAPMIRIFFVPNTFRVFAILADRS